MRSYQGPNEAQDWEVLEDNCSTNNNSPQIEQDYVSIAGYQSQDVAIPKEPEHDYYELIAQQSTPTIDLDSAIQDKLQGKSEPHQQSQAIKSASSTATSSPFNIVGSQGQIISAQPSATTPTQPLNQSIDPQTSLEPLILASNYTQYQPTAHSYGQCSSHQHTPVQPLHMSAPLNQAPKQQCHSYENLSRKSSGDSQQQSTQIQLLGCFHRPLFIALIGNRSNTRLVLKHCFLPKDADDHSVQEPLLVRVRSNQKDVHLVLQTIQEDVYLPQADFLRLRPYILNVQRQIPGQVQPQMQPTHPALINRRRGSVLSMVLLAGQQNESGIEVGVNICDFDQFIVAMENDLPFQGPRLGKLVVDQAVEYYKSTYSILDSALLSPIDDTAALLDEPTPRARSTTIVKRFRRWCVTIWKKIAEGALIYRDVHTPPCHTNPWFWGVLSFEILVGMKVMSLLTRALLSQSSFCATEAVAPLVQLAKEQVQENTEAEPNYQLDKAYLPCAPQTAAARQPAHYIPDYSQQWYYGQA